MSKKILELYPKACYHGGMIADVAPGTLNYRGG